MFHTFFNHSSIEGHLGCFQVLVITNSAAMNIVEQMKSMYLYFTEDKTSSESYELFLWLGISIINENEVF